MTWSGRLRFAGMPWLAGLFMASALVFADQEAPGAADYPLAITAGALGSTALVGPLAAAAAAWTAWRLGRASAAASAGVRPPWQLTAGVVVPIAAVAMTALTVTALTRLVLEGVPPVPDLGAVLAATFVVVGLTSAGAAFGVMLPVAIAAPLAAATSYVWLTFPLTMNTLWVRQMTGMWLDCCLADQQIRPGAVAAVGAVYGSMTVAAVAVVRWRWGARGGRRQLAVRGAAVVAGLIAAVALVRGTGAYPSEPRADTLACVQRVVQTCVWPEHADQLNQVAAEATRLARRLDAIDATRPSTISEANPARVPLGTGDLVVVRQMRQQDLLANVATALAPSIGPQCEQRLSGRGASGSRMFEDLEVGRALVLARSGVVEWRVQFDPQVAGRVDLMLRQSDSDQGAWLTRLRSRALTCDGAAR